MIRVRKGHCCKVSCRPKPISSNNSVKPSVAPNTWRMPGQKPKLAPALSATMLTGPGVMDDAKANAAIEISKLIENSSNTIRNDRIKVMTATHSVLKEITLDPVSVIRRARYKT
ncbi:hypothetical protein ALO99_101440 [Pseudomonas coronafaciens pv. porri]|nr:hypothetical protein ALO89_101403 [Pseudomonas coronafaciens pv. porri]RMW11459.1 hypothetical protein ALO99_101440 [Pseudomonas coronafaciens pv. porri]